jgi:bifunctional non-homologous end joining protein LigD
MAKKPNRAKLPSKPSGEKSRLQTRSAQKSTRRSTGASRKTSQPIARTGAAASIPADVDDAEINLEGGSVRLTNLRKVFWPELRLTKRDLLQYYLDVAPWLLPHVKDRAMVMKRYPNGIAGDFFFMKRAPTPRPSSIPICSIEHHSGNVIDFPVVQNTASLLWVVNLGCIDLNPWYARCDDVNRPDYLHFDLDPVPGASFKQVLETALIVRDALASIKIESYPKTTGSRGIHVYVPIVRGPEQKQVWAFAKAFAIELAKRNPDLITAEYRIAKRPAGRVLVDYNQNAWNRTLASVYSVRPKPAATVSTPLTWEEVKRGVSMEDFTMKTVPSRLAKIGDLWKPLLAQTGRTNLDPYL